MYLNNKQVTKCYLVYLLMVAPVTAHANLNEFVDDSADALDYADTFFDNQPEQTSAWFTHAGLHYNADVLINAIADAEAHGLNPAAYQLASLERDLESFIEQSEHLNSYHDDSTTGIRELLEAKLDMAFARFANDLGSGALDAQKTQKDLFRPAPIIDTETLLQRLNTGDATVRELLKEVAPSTPAYRKLVAQMRLLLKERESGYGRTQVRFFGGVTIDTEHASVVALRKRLQELRALDADAELSTAFDFEVEDALKTIQSRYGITANGELNERTVIALNASVDDDIEEVAMNLERWRWMPRELGERHIFINIPAYNLTMMNGAQKIVDMPVVVGSRKHQTPVFSKGARYVEIAPTWTVPASITNNELIPLERRRPGYLKSKNFDFFAWQDGKLSKVPSSHVTPEDIATTPFPYVLRQRAGDNNALGKLKILMPNKYAIYMHDTQAKSLFNKTDRAYSHGCVRLSDPFRLGSLLLQLDGKTPEETIALLGRKKTKRVRLQHKVPTHISYFTAWVDDDGFLNQRRDIYRHNKRLLAALHSNNTLLTALKSRPISIYAESYGS